MGATRILPDSATLRLLRTQDWKLAEIAEKYGVSESAVWKALERAGETEPLPTYRSVVPWDIQPQHKKTAVMDHLRTIATERGGRVPSAPRKAYLEEWLKGMQDAGVVLNYHPDAPPNSASNKHGGFYYVPREAGDEWIIRQPESCPPREEPGGVQTSQSDNSDEKAGQDW